MRDEEFTQHFTRGEAIAELGAVGVEVYIGRLRQGATAVEDKLQAYIKNELKVNYPNRLFREVAKGIKREDDDTLNGAVTIFRTFLSVFEIVDDSADWGDDDRKDKSYPKSVRFVNAEGEETTVFIQA